MKRRTTTFLLILFVALLSFSSCDSDDGVSSSNLIGNYIMASMLDKTSGLTFTAGQPNDFMGMTITISGTLTLTESTFRAVNTTITSFEGETNTEVTTEEGTYTTSGSSMTVTDLEGDISNMTYSLVGSEFSMENDEMKLIYTKQ